MGKYVRPSQINQVTRWTGRSLAVLFTTITVSACTNGNTGTGTNMPPSVTPVTSPLGSSLPRDTSATPASSTKHTKNKSEKSGEPDETVAEARKTFGSLAPSSLFDKFEVCTPNGVEGSLACSGKEVGQFQFFASDSKAASSTQLLTGLRNSRVIKDTGKLVVGWSTLGSTAVITVVDNEKGLVMQQMVSTDTVDPTKRIYQLGLADESETSEVMETTEEEQPEQ